MPIKFDSTFPAQVTDFFSARFGEIGDAWGSVSEKHPEASNIALMGAGVFTLFNIFQGGGFFSSISRGVVALAGIFGIALVAKSVADDDTPAREPRHFPAGGAKKVAASSLPTLLKGAELSFPEDNVADDYTPVAIKGRLDESVIAAIAMLNVSDTLTDTTTAVGHLDNSFNNNPNQPLQLTPSHTVLMLKTDTLKEAGLIDR